MSPASIAIVGAGQAGAMAAAALRESGYAGRLTLVGKEVHAPYERPPLSKDVLAAPVEPELGVLGRDRYRELDIEWRPGIEAIVLEPAAHLIGLSDGSTLWYDRCLLATGGTARELPALPRGIPGVHYLRTLDDARRLRAALVPGCRVLVVGGGFLGLELASAARRLQAEVDLLETAPRLLDRFLPPDASQWLAGRVRQAGVQLHLGTSLKAARRVGTDADGGPFCVETGRGALPPADIVVVSVGLVPENGLARNAGLEIDSVNSGIRIDADCRTSEADIFAAGDCASQYRDLVRGHARFESWQNANEQARTAAAAMLSRTRPAAAYPWFWSDQFDCNLQMLGLPAADLEYVLRGAPDRDAPKAIWLGHRRGVPVHALAVNAGGDLRQIRCLFESGIGVDPLAFCEEPQPLRSFVKAAQAAHANNAGVSAHGPKAAQAGQAAVS